MDIDAIRNRLASGDQAPWKTLDELADDADLRRWLEDEFPNRRVLPTTSRRDLLRLMGASMAMAGLTGCRGAFMPQLHLVPYVEGPAEQTYGQPVTYRSALGRHGYGFGIEVVTRDGRPIKVEGNPNHPASLGSTDSITQASILEFYDPDRSRAPFRNGEVATWDEFVQLAQQSLGSGFRVLTETLTSPTITRQLEALRKTVPEMRVHSYEPLNRDATHRAGRLAFGRDLTPVYSLKTAEVFLGIDFDLDRPELGSLVSARGLTQQPGRIYSVSSTPTYLENLADHRRALAPGELENFVYSLATAIGAPGYTAQPDAWAQAVAADLLRSKGKCCVAVGERQPAELQAAGYAINDALANFGRTVSFVESPETSPADQAGSMRELVGDMLSGKVGFLLILGSNPVFTLPAEIRFTEALSKVAVTAHHGIYRDETARLCHWHLPATHDFEAWNDLGAFDGSFSIVQPIVQPLYEGRSVLSLLSLIAGQPVDDLKSVRTTWSKLSTEEWTEALRLGTLGKTNPITPATRRLDQGVSTGAEGANVLFRPDPMVDDGRYSNSGWLQEAPKPHTGLVWDNAILMGPSLASELQLENGDHVEVLVGEKRCVGPVWITPGHAAGCATMHLGGGRTSSGVVGDGVGYDAYPLRDLASPDLAAATFRKVAGYTDLVSTQSHHRMDGRDLIRSVEVGGSLPQEKPDYGFHDLTAKWNQKPGIPQWGMSIDLDKCIGCNACVIACQAENSISTVGKEEVRRGREMHWIRIDRYYTGNDLERVQTLLQPVTCMQCETAPCEPVCPVAATVHSHEGLNQMIYNRCVGTRYCSNNCPYKVRRFNYLNYQLLQPNYQGEQGIQLLKLLNNPDVTIRSRGVMEKCTYCIQRITAARINADVEGRPIADGEVVTACAQACPTQTIVFGNLADSKSAIRALRQDPRQYPLLPELLTVPRTTYLARIDNPNPEVPIA
jgi:MoCo/4Fe-4S cofactor protein with predicted Tat translocation signal